MVFVINSPWTQCWRQQQVHHRELSGAYLLQLRQTVLHLDQAV